jgi:spermidine/putrescine transport system substrate-binding protein
MNSPRALIAFLSLLVLGFTTCLQAALAKKPGLRLFCWSEYVPQEVIDGFTKETGIKVQVENYASNEEMLAKLAQSPGKYDLIQPSEYVIEALVREGQLAELNLADIPNIKNLDPAFTKLPYDPEGKYSVPWMSGSVGIVVNTDKIKTPIHTYEDVFDGSHTGRIVVLNDNREIVSWALSSLGLSVNDVTPANLDKIKPVLGRWLPQVKDYDSDSPKTALLNGDVDLGIVWSGEAAILYQKSPKFLYILPSDHVHRFIDSLAIPKGAANKANAEKFINYILRPEVSVKISNAFPYTNPNAEARKRLTREQLGNPASYPPGDPKLEPFKDIGAAAKDIDILVNGLKGKS